jgi:hypothetical protein
MLKMFNKMIFMKEEKMKMMRKKLSQIIKTLQMKSKRIHSMKMNLVQMMRSISTKEMIMLMRKDQRKGISSL